MKGAEIKTIRESLGLDRRTWAALFGAHFSSVYRWESESREVKFGELRLKVCTLLQGYCACKDQDEQIDLGKKIHKANLIRGPLFALYVLMKECEVDKPMKMWGKF